MISFGIDEKDGGGLVVIFLSGGSEFIPVEVLIGGPCLKNDSFNLRKHDSWGAFLKFISILYSGIKIT